MILIPLYDPDTGMLFLAGKGDTTISYLEVTDREPYLIEGIRHNGEQTKGACLVPKRALAVMQGEVNRLLQLTSSSVIPIMYQVPRKVHRGSLSEMRKHLQHSPYTNVTQQKTSNIIQTSVKPKEEENFTKEQKREKDGERSNSENGLHQNGDSTKIHQQNGSSENHQIVPPKPLPRASRAGSLETEDVVVAPPKPKPRTTTSAFSTPQPTSVVPTVTSVNPATPITGGYKPRLGPKPFTPPKLNFSSSGSGDGDVKGTTEFSFDKVFSVPVAPGNEARNGMQNRHADNTESENNGIPQSLNYIENDQDGKGNENEINKSPSDILLSPTKEMQSSLEYENKSESGPKIEDTADKDAQPNSGSFEDDQPPSSPLSHGKANTPSTAERRKLYEKRISTVATDMESMQVAGEDADDKLEDFERASVQRTSIAERRRLYENRSVSVQEAGTADKRSPTLSPTPLRRRDSFKGAKSGEADSTTVNKKQPVVMQRQQSQEGKTQEKKPEPVTTPTPKRTSTVFGRVSKFRHLKGTPLHKSTHIENIRNISRQISGECDGFHANPERVAVPLSGPGGKIAVFELTCDDGMIRLWLIPEDGLAEPTNEPHTVLAGHSEKIYFIKFHPLAKDVLATGSYDMTIRIWDLATQTEKIVLEGHTDQMFSFAWSPCGGYCATVSKDSKLRVYRPRSNTQPIREGKGPVGSRGARVVWALEGRFIVVMGFDKVSERQIQVFKADNLNSTLNTVGLDVSPAILIPFYDEDSSTLFLTGKGDSTIYAFEVTEEAPYICPLSHHRCNSLHQGLSFLPKSVCDVANVEFARALRLTNNTIEPLSFTVPRIKSDLFQDDLFPPTKVTWKPTMTSAQWFQGMDKQPTRLSLKPEGMECCEYIIQRAVSNRMEVNLKLEQDEMEGVDDREWED
ncbi:hypothetical protein C0J52_04075 [Blattella germanica]|nr:hypothetical protein C0J52_04075 [Blattella germanica]